MRTHLNADVVDLGRFILVPHRTAEVASEFIVSLQSISLQMWRLNCVYLQLEVSEIWNST